MKNAIKQLLSTKGISLMELLVAMVVMIVIMTAVVAIFTPMHQAFQRANNLAEVNTLLDNISALIMDDVASANEVLPLPGGPITIDGVTLNPLFRLRTSFFIDYYIQITDAVNGSGILWRGVQGLDPIRLLPLHYYRFWGEGQTVFTVVEAGLNLNQIPGGVVTLDITIRSTDGWTRDRTYTARPIGLS